MIRFGLIGDPISHSVSPEIFSKAYGGRWPYDLIEGADFNASWKRFLDEYQAINITAPFKEPAFREVMANGVMDAEVQAIGAINIAVKETDGRIHGYNSDFLGVMKVLRDHGFREGSTVVVAGFGGAGKAAAAAALKGKVYIKKGLRNYQSLYAYSTTNFPVNLPKYQRYSIDLLYIITKRAFGLAVFAIG